MSCSTSALAALVPLAAASLSNHILATLIALTLKILLTHILLVKPGSLCDLMQAPVAQSISLLSGSVFALTIALMMKLLLG